MPPSSPVPQIVRVSLDERGSLSFSVIRSRHLSARSPPVMQHADPGVLPCWSRISAESTVAGSSCSLRRFIGCSLCRRFSWARSVRRLTDTNVDEFSLLGSLRGQQHGLIRPHHLPDEYTWPLSQAQAVHIFRAVREQTSFLRTGLFLWSCPCLPRSVLRMSRGFHLHATDHPASTCL